MAHIRYQSVYGSTKEYAEELARRLGTKAFDFGEPIPEDSAPVIALSPVHGPSIPAVQFVRGITERPVAVAAVGMTLLDVARDKDFLRGHVAEDVARFYLPGKLEFSTMSTAHKATLNSISTILKAKPRKSRNDVAMIEAMGKDTDRMDFHELDQIVAWARACAS